MFDADSPTTAASRRHEPVAGDAVRSALVDELSDMALPLIWSLGQAAQRALEPFDFRPLKALLLGSIVAGTRSPKELAELLETAPPTMSALFADLEERGLVERRPDPEDRRRVLIEATDEGRAMTLRFREAWQKTTAERIDALSDDDLRHLLRIARHLTETP